jgi:hypothetical protein
MGLYEAGSVGTLFFFLIIMMVRFLIHAKSSESSNSGAALSWLKTLTNVLGIIEKINLKREAF